MINVIALDITFRIPFNLLNITSHSKVKYFLQLYQNPRQGHVRPSVVALGALDKVEEVRQGHKGLHLLQLPCSLPAALLQPGGVGGGRACYAIVV